MISLSNYKNAFTNDADTINDAIIIMRNMAADVNEPSNGIIAQRSSDESALAVSYQVYRWSLGFNVIISDPIQIQEMTSAIEANIGILQPAIEAMRTSESKIASMTHFGCERIRKSYSAHLSEGAIHADEISESEYIKSVLAPMQKEFDNAQGKVYVGSHNLHPNQYLQSLGVKKLRLTALEKQYLD